MVDNFEQLKVDILSFFNEIKGEELIPDSSKVVVFDSRLAIKHAFFGLLEHNVTCAPLWSNENGDYVGMLTVTDFINTLRYLYLSNSSDFSSAVTTAVDQTISEWLIIQKNHGYYREKLISITPMDTLCYALKVFRQYHVHRIAVKHNVNNTILCILTYHRILTFFLSKFLSSQLLKQINVTDFYFKKDIPKVSYSTPLINVLNFLHDYELSSIPVIDSNGLLLDCYNRSDVRYLALDNTYTNLNISIKQAISSHSEKRTLPTCLLSDSLNIILESFIETGRHTLFVIESHTNPLLIGYLPIESVFNFLLGSIPIDEEHKQWVYEKEEEIPIDKLDSLSPNFSPLAISPGNPLFLEVGVAMLAQAAKEEKIKEESEKQTN